MQHDSSEFSMTFIGVENTFSLNIWQLKYCRLHQLFLYRLKLNNVLFDQYVQISRLAFPQFFVEYL